MYPPPTHTRTLRLHVSPVPPVASRGRTNHSSPDSLALPTWVVSVSAFLDLYPWATSSATFPCPWYLPGYPLSHEHLCSPNTALDLRLDPDP